MADLRLSPKGDGSLLSILRRMDADPMHAVLSAIAKLEADLARRGGAAASYGELAALKLSTGDANGAVAAYLKCLGAAGPSAGLLNNLGGALTRAGRYPEAIAALEGALELQPGYLRALVNLGKALREAGRVPEAMSRLREALAIDGSYVPALVNLGDALAASGELSDAEQALATAVQIDPGAIEARSSLGIVRLQAGRIASAIDDLRAAVALAPQHADAHANLGHALFTSGDWAAAWPHFEFRFRRSAHRAVLRPPKGIQRWDGELSPELELWLIGEQGLGDQLQFARYAALLSKRDVQCVLACDPRLVKLLSFAKLAQRVVPLDGAANIAAQNPLARWLPLLSIAGWHRTSPHTVPSADGYLSADALRIAAWRSRLPVHSLRVALAWAGNPHVETGRYAGRSPPFAALAALSEVPNVCYISLQKGPGEDQVKGVPLGRSLLRFDDLDAGPDAFLDTAAILTCVDLVVTSDTAIAHLAGALGVPTWLCLMRDPDWRWMHTGERTPWYSSMRLFRQRTAGDWPGVYATVARELAREVQRSSALKTHRER
jgi:tetratricopeptide (TPR) repeat protein